MATSTLGTLEQVLSSGLVNQGAMPLDPLPGTVIDVHVWRVGQREWRVLSYSRDRHLLEHTWLHTWAEVVAWVNAQTPDTNLTTSVQWMSIDTTR